MVRRIMSVFHRLPTFHQKPVPSSDTLLIEFYSFEKHRFYRFLRQSRFPSATPMYPFHRRLKFPKNKSIALGIIPLSNKPWKQKNVLCRSEEHTSELQSRG